MKTLCVLFACSLCFCFIGAIHGSHDITVELTTTASATTAREEIVTGMCTFGGCPVATTATTLPPTTEESTNLEVFSNSELLTTQESEEEPVTESHNDGYIGTFWITGYTAEEGFPEGSPTASGYGVRPVIWVQTSSIRR